MARPPSKHPTESELEILAVLWERKNCTVRDIHDVISASRDVSYNTISATVAVMIEKGLIEVIDARKPQRVAPVRDRDTVVRGMLEHLSRIAFGGSQGDLLKNLMGVVKRRDVDEARRALRQAREKDSEDSSNP